MSPSVNHSYIQMMLGSALVALKQYTVYSELSIEIDGKEYVPDICLYSKREFDPLNDIIRMKEMPLLAIEILSPTQLIQELVDKIKIYLNTGVQSCWLVIPVARSIMVFHGIEKSKTFIDCVVDDKLNISLPFFSF